MICYYSGVKNRYKDTELMFLSMCLFKRRSANNTSPAERKESRIYRQQRSEVTMLDAYKECSFLSGASLTLTMSTAFQHTHTMFLLHWACFGLVELCVYVYECVCVWGKVLVCVLQSVVMAAHRNAELSTIKAP